MRACLCPPNERREEINKRDDDQRDKTGEPKDSVPAFLPAHTYTIYPILRLRMFS